MSTNLPSPIRLALLLGGSLILAPAAQAVAPPSQPAAYVPGEVIVGYRSAAAAIAAKADQRRLGLKLRRSLEGGRVQVLELPALTDVESALPVIAADPRVAYAEPNWIRSRRAVIPNDPLFEHQWGLHSTGQPNFATNDPAFASIVGADMNMPAAWDANNDGIADRTGDGSAIVAIIDDAVLTTHEDLAANIMPGADLADGDNNPDPDIAALDHGTLVAGAVGAVGNNGIGVAGVAWNVRLMPLKVGRIRDGEVQLSNDAILAAYAHARDNGAHIVNASYGGPHYSQAEFDAIARLRDAGVLFVTSAGNFNSNLDYSVAAYPANYDLPNVMSMAASNRQDNVASFSQYGPISTDAAAPGLQIVTTAADGGYSVANRCGQNNGSCGVNGTSFAAPYTAGAAALIRMAIPGADYREIRARLIEGAEPGVAGGDVGRLTAGGRIDVDNSLDMAPGPALLIHGIEFVDDGNDRLDPGETLQLRIEIENLWQPATAIEATLQTDHPDIAITSGPAQLAALAQGARGTLTFDLQVGAQRSPYEEVDFALVLSANAGAYSATRPLRLEFAELQAGEPVDETLSTGLHDEFHTYHFDLPQAPGAGTRLLVCTQAGEDIDVLVKRGAHAQYDIDLGAPPEDDPTYYHDADYIGGGWDGNETVAIADPAAGTYYITVLNYALAEALPYQLEVRLESTQVSPPGASTATCSPGVDGGTGGGTGGGLLGGGPAGGGGGLGGLLAALAAAWGLRAAVRRPARLTRAAR